MIFQKSGCKKFKNLNIEYKNKMPKMIFGDAEKVYLFGNRGDDNKYIFYFEKLKKRLNAFFTLIQVSIENVVKNLVSAILISDTVFTSKRISSHCVALRPF